jgi:phosphatidylserine decarboxylase
MKTRLFILLQYLLPQHRLSRLAGFLANWQAPTWLLQAMLRKFVAKYQVDLSQALNPDLADYKSFNQFFTRKLLPEARPIGEGVCSPADGTISQIGKIQQQQLLQAKGKHYSLAQLLANESSLIETFSSGDLATIYLSPRDYHRVHMPYTGKLVESIYVPGKLFSVNPTTVNNVDSVFARNERLINIFETDKGKMAVILVGALLVAGINTVWQGQITPNKFHQVQHWNYQQQDITLAKGDELGYFNFGSTVILLFEANKIAWLNNLVSEHTLQMGETIGH